MDGRDRRHVMQVEKGGGAGHPSGVGADQFFNRDQFWISGGGQILRAQDAPPVPIFLGFFFLFIAPGWAVKTFFLNSKCKCDYQLSNGRHPKKLRSSVYRCGNTSPLRHALLKGQ